MHRPRRFDSIGLQKIGERATQGIGELLQRLDRRVRLTGLDQGDSGLRQPGSLRQFGLSQSGTLARPADVGAEDHN